MARWLAARPLRTLRVLSPAPYHGARTGTPTRLCHPPEERAPLTPRAYSTAQNELRPAGGEGWRAAAVRQGHRHATRKASGPPLVGGGPLETGRLRLLYRFRRWSERWQVASDLAPTKGWFAMPFSESTPSSGDGRRNRVREAGAILTESTVVFLTDGLDDLDVTADALIAYIDDPRASYAQHMRAARVLGAVLCATRAARYGEPEL